MELENVEKAVCLIQSTGKGNQVYEGTGFHFGRHWIMSVAHNFQDNQERDQTSHNIMSEGKFKVTWHGHEFEEHKRMAFVHHLKPDGGTDFKHKDIAMFKLGKQYEYGRHEKDYSTWEKTEDETLSKMDAASCGIANVQLDPPDPKEEEIAYAFHYGGGNNTLRVDQPKITKITAIQGTKRAPSIYYNLRNFYLGHLRCASQS